MLNNKPNKPVKVTKHSDFSNVCRLNGFNLQL